MSAKTSVRWLLASALFSMSVFGAAEHPWTATPLAHECAALLAAARVRLVGVSSFRTPQELSRAGILESFPVEAQKELRSLLFKSGRPNPDDIFYAVGDAADAIYRDGKRQAAFVWARGEVDEREATLRHNVETAIDEGQRKYNLHSLIAVIAGLVSGGTAGWSALRDGGAISVPTVVAGTVAASAFAYLVAISIRATIRDDAAAEYYGTDAQNARRMRADEEVARLAHSYRYRGFFQGDSPFASDFTVDLERPMPDGTTEYFAASLHIPHSWVGRPQLLLIHWPAK